MELKLDVGNDTLFVAAIITEEIKLGDQYFPLERACMTDVITLTHSSLLTGAVLQS